MPNLELGQCICPLCKSKYPQVIKQSEKSGKPYLNCEECGMQLFARSLESVRILRKMALESVCDTDKPTAAPVAVPKPTAAPVAVPKPTAAPVAAPKPTAAPVAAPKPAAPELPTMFDALGSLFSTTKTKNEGDENA